MEPNKTVQSWTCSPPAIDPAHVLRVHKYRDPEKVRPIIREAAELAVSRAQDLSKPQARFVISAINHLTNCKLETEGGIVFNSPAFERHLGSSEYLLAFVMTLGPNLDNAVISLLEDEFEPLDALFLETVGWLTIERATKLFSRHLKEEFERQGWTLSLRMGPGYDYPSDKGDARVSWDLWQQRELFQLFGTAPLPVSLSEVCAMHPKMSRSGVHGLNRK